MAGDPRYMESSFNGRCFVCNGYYNKGDQIWYEPSKNGSKSRACHPACRTVNAQQGPQQYMFTNRDMTSQFDRLVYEPKDMLVRAFELSAEHNEPCAVARLENNKWVAMFMISAAPGVSLIPAPPEPEVDKPTEGPLFEWPAGAKQPY